MRVRRRSAALLLTLGCCAILLGWFFLRDPVHSPTGSPAETTSSSFRADRASPEPRPLVAIGGRVVDPFGHPVPNASVSLHSPSRDLRQRIHSTDTGEFTFKPARAGDYTIRVDSAEWGQISSDGAFYSDSSVELVFPNQGRAKVLGRIDATEVQSRLPLLRLFQALSDGGRTLLIPEIKIERKPLSVGESFTIEGLSIGEYLLEGRSMSQLYEHPFSIERNDQILEVTIRLSEGIPVLVDESSVFGRAYLDDLEHPLADDQISCQVVWPHGMRSSGTILTDDAGRFEWPVRLLTAGAEVKFEYPGSSEIVRKITEDSEQLGLELVFERFSEDDNGTGIVVDSQDWPVPYADVVFLDSLVTRVRRTNSDGEFPLAGIPVGDYSIHVYHDDLHRGRRKHEVRIRVSDEHECVIRLPIESGLTLTFSDSAGERVSAGQLFLRTGPQTEWRNREIPDTGGLFFAVTEAETVVEVVACVPEAHLFAAEEITFDPQQPTALITMLPPTRRIEVSVTDSTGEAIRDAIAMPTLLYGWQAARAVEDFFLEARGSDGTYVLSEFLDNPHELIVFSSAGAVRVDPRDLREDRRIVLGSEGCVLGRISRSHEESGVPTGFDQGFLVELLLENERRFVSRTSDRYCFYVGYARPKRLRVSAAGGGMLTVDDIPVGEVLELKFE